MQIFVAMFLLINIYHSLDPLLVTGQILFYFSLLVCLRQYIFNFFDMVNR